MYNLEYPLLFVEVIHRMVNSLHDLVDELHNELNQEFDMLYKNHLEDIQTKI